MHLHLQLQEVKRCFFHFCHMHIHPITSPSLIADSDTQIIESGGMLTCIVLR